MLLFPPAKINIGLYVTEKRPDGYHNIETIFYAVPELRDVLEAVPATSSEATMTMTGLPVAGRQEDNLVWKAYVILRERFPDRIPALDWHLHKAIPMGAGLGGGSADGAYALRLLNNEYDLGLSVSELTDLALMLGSDCPFFLQDVPCFGEGRGEKLESVTLDLSGFAIRIIPSEIHVATGRAFGLLTPRPAPFDLRRLHELPVPEWKAHIGNDFEEPVFSMHPELRDTKKRLYAEGAVYAQMSGSGSAVFGVFAN